jgi:hypothetical protein
MIVKDKDNLTFDEALKFSRLHKGTRVARRRGKWIVERGDPESTVKVDRKVPISKSKRIKRKRYPWLEMEVGDSFLVRELSFHSVRLTVMYASRRFGLTFVARQTEEGVRVWRSE